MRDALAYLAEVHGVNVRAKSPIEIPNIGRDGLARMFHALDCRIGAEVGVEQGLYSEVLCRENPGVQLYCVDAWRAYRGYRDHVSQGKLDGFFAAATERLRPYHATLIRQFSLEAVKRFEDNSLDFVYIDAAHDVQNCTNDIAEWGKKVRVGGIIAGHDYVRYTWPNTIHVVQAVNAWADAYELQPWFLLGTQAKVDGEVRDTARSWFWVKPPHRVEKHRGTIKQ